MTHDHPRGYRYRIRQERWQRQREIWKRCLAVQLRRAHEQLARTHNPADYRAGLMSLELLSQLGPPRVRQVREEN